MTLAYHWLPVARSILGAINRVVYRGNAYECPLCGSHLRAFLPLPDHFKTTLHIAGMNFSESDFETLNVSAYQCPVCRCSDRDRLVTLYLLHIRCQQKTAQRMLHFAPEPALSAYLRKQKAYHYTTADLTMPHANLQLDITHMTQVADHSVDCFICSHVLEHIPDDRQALAELFRILRPAGWGVVMSPILPSLNGSYEDDRVTSEAGRLTHFGQADHVRVYGKTDFIARLRNTGFHVLELGAGFFGAATFTSHGIAPSSVLYIVEKNRI